jgi:hypothetical protein
MAYLDPESPQTTILILHSTPDDSTTRRIATMDIRAEKLGFRLHHLTVITHEYATENDENLKPKEWIMKNQGELWRRISTAISISHPQYFFLHTGVAFMIAPLTILEVIADLREQYPAMTFGIQQSVMLKMTLDEKPSIAAEIEEMFDHSEDTEKLVAALFP